MNFETHKKNLFAVCQKTIEMHLKEHKNDLAFLGAVLIFTAGDQNGFMAVADQSYDKGFIPSLSEDEYFDVSEFIREKYHVSVFRTNSHQLMNSQGSKIGFRYGQDDLSDVVIKNEDGLDEKGGFSEKEEKILSNIAEFILITASFNDIYFEITKEDIARAIKLFPFCRKRHMIDVTKKISRFRKPIRDAYYEWVYAVNALAVQYKSAE